MGFRKKRPKKSTRQGLVGKFGFLASVATLAGTLKSGYEKVVSWQHIYLFAAQNAPHRSSKCA